MDPIRIQVKLINLSIHKNPNTLDLKDQVQEFNFFYFNFFQGFQKFFYIYGLNFCQKDESSTVVVFFPLIMPVLYIIYLILFQIVKGFKNTFQIRKIGHFFKISCCIPNEPKRCPLPPLSPISLQENKRKKPNPKIHQEQRVAPYVAHIGQHIVQGWQLM